MKASMRNSLYKVLVILSNSSGDVCPAACTCPAGAGLDGFGNCNHVGGVLFALESSTERVIKSAQNLCLAHQGYQHGMFLPLLFQSILPPLIKQLSEKLNLGKIMIILIRQSIFVMIPESVQIAKLMRKDLKSYSQSLPPVYLIAVFSLFIIFKTHQHSSVHHCP